MSHPEPSDPSARRDPDGRTTQSEDGAARRRSEDGVLGRRVGAFLADTLLVVGVCDAASARRTSTTRGRLALTTALAAALGFLYHVALEGRFGQTVGKRWFGVAVVSVDGRPCTYRAAFVRTAGRVVDALPVGYLAGFAAILLTPRDRRLGDLLAGTVVVRAEGREAEGASSGTE